MDDPTLQLLEDRLAPSQLVLSGWEFSAVGYGSSDPAYLSFSVPLGCLRENLQVWHHDASGWTEYAPTDLNCDGIYANFTAIGFSGYAIVTVPEPGAMALLLMAAAAAGVLGYGWRRRMRNEM